MAGNNSWVTRFFKHFTSFRTILVFQISTGCLLCIVGFCCTLISYLSTYTNLNLGCNYGTGIWVGILTVVTNCLGFTVIWKPKKQRPLIWYFVLTIVSSAAVGILMSISVIWAVQLAKYKELFEESLEIVSCYTLDILMVILCIQYVLICLYTTVLLYGQWIKTEEFANRAQNKRISTVDLTLTSFPSPRFIPKQLAPWAPFSNLRPHVQSSHKDAETSTLEDSVGEMWDEQTKHLSLNDLDSSESAQSRSPTSMTTNSDTTTSETTEVIECTRL